MLQDSTAKWYSGPPVEPLPVHGGDPLRPACVELARRLRSRETELREAVLAHVSSAAADAGEDAQPA